MEKKYNAYAIIEIITGIGIALFWICFFTVGLAPENPPQCYFAYEHSFPLPDAFLSLCLIASGYNLLKGRDIGKILALVSSGGLVFLGLIDLSFNLQNGMYLISAMDLILNGFINIFCIVFGVILIIKFKK